MNLLPHNSPSEREHTWILGGIILFGIALLLISVLTSPWVLLAGLLFAAAVYATWKEPMWTVMALSAWWPIEPFILKWIGDDIYVFARYASEIMIYVLAGVVVLSVLIGRYHKRVTPADIPFALFVLMLVVSIILNTLPVGQALLGLRQIVRFMLLFWVIVYRYPRRYWMRWMVMIIVGMMALQAVLGLTQALVGGSMDTFLLPSERRTFGELQLTEGTVQFWDPGQRVFGTMGRYDRLGTFLALALLLVIGFVYESGRKPNWQYLGLFGFIGLPALILTYSRSAWFGLILGALAIALVRKDKRVFAAAGIVFLLFAGYLGVNGLSNSLADVPRQTVAERFLEAFTYQRFVGEYYGLGRVYWIVTTPTIVVPNNMVSLLFGWGPAQYGGGAVAALGNTRVYDAIGEPFGIYGTEGYIDNNWMALWGEAGTLGIAFYLWGYIVLLLLAIKIARHSRISFTRALALAYVGIAVSVAVNASLATFLEVRTLAPYFWMLGGCVVVLGSREKLIQTQVRET
ncbi:hypothetical protein COV06_02275 [Candidatus Uhrbacteria bacterium CG10_big_fil_rev_8_21_14_0_10_50_16]|uniref:Uncharacterized protein n=1 Tax=Candidatus Uhrbacteria bacterium CG10_big_fil_rev_8_21_14_0_10_50_16 TaxID=1975039 RepID=A0A2H0RMG0_9BACT|nr:MAG: hypothetical protein COV06_02275 [Candidatus Uhrbacteria bacterium CG10_big_fil_rev_8_21_14_0_10_50_16]